MSNCKQKLNLSNRILEELYEDKVNQVIKIEDFERMYRQTNEDKKETIKKIKEIEVERKQIEEKLGGICCGRKGTSCGDQLAKACRKALSEAM